MNKILAFIIGAVVLPFLVTGCRGVDGGERGFTPAAASEQIRLQHDTEKFGEGILTAFQHGDFPAFIKNTPGELAELVTEKDFRTSCRNFNEKYGKLQDFRFLTALDTPAFCNLIWVVTFVRAGTNGTEIRRQLLFRVVSMPDGDKTKVISYGFM